jgi:hypothetical protein
MNLNETKKDSLITIYYYYNSKKVDNFEKVYFKTHKTY